MYVPLSFGLWSIERQSWYRPFGREVIRVSGPDSLTFLQSMLTQDLAGLEIDSGVHALFLDTRGHLAADLFVYREREDSVLLLVEGGAASETISRLKRFLIRTDAVIEHCTDVQLVVVGQDRASSAGPGAVTIANIRWDMGGVTLLLDAASETPSGNEISPMEWEWIRIQSRVPRWGDDLDESVLPHEAWLDQDAISFTKGCFLGQEVVCRIDTRGRSTRFLRVVNSERRLEVGDEISNDGKVLGTITSVAQSDGGYCALAFLHHSVEPNVTLESPRGKVSISQ